MTANQPAQKTGESQTERGGFGTWFVFVAIAGIAVFVGAGE